MLRRVAGWAGPEASLSCWLLGSRTTLLVAPGTSAGRAGLSCAWAGRWMGKACLIHTWAGGWVASCWLEQEAKAWPAWGWAQPRGCEAMAYWVGWADRPGQPGCWLGWAGAQSQTRQTGLASRRSCFSGQKSNFLVISWMPTNPKGLGGEKRRFSLEKRSERPWPLWGRGELFKLLISLLKL